MNTTLRHIAIKYTALLLLTGLANRSAAQLFKISETKVTYKGNQFTLPPTHRIDTVITTDPISGDEVWKIIQRAPMPTAMNGKKIYEMKDVTPAPQQYTMLEKYILNKLKSSTTLKALPDGAVAVYLGDIILDEKGKVVYYEYNGTKFTGADKQMRSVNMEEPEIDKILSDAPPMYPATADGKKVIVRSDISMYKYEFAVNKHTISWKSKK